MSSLARCLVLALALLTAVAACGADAKTPADSGIKGRVFIGPLCPVVQEGVPCPDAPYDASIRVRRASGNVVATVRSGKDGRFRINLGPGRYVLEPLSRGGGAPPSAAPVAVRVRAHAFTRVKITYDSGIR
jgi:hypothetical protein